MIRLNFLLIKGFLFAFPILLFGQINYDTTCEIIQHETGNITTGIYKTQEELSANGNIEVDATVIFQAKDRIQLQTNFSVPPNSSFVAENVVCNDIVADVIEVSTTGNPNSYTFAVTIQSPDTGCNQYANWWEVISLNGQLIYRRVLGHSHVTEQPFTRTGGSVNISENTEVIVRAWMHPTGYGGKVFKGSVANGFECTVLSSEFAKALSEQEPLPTSCSF